MPTTVYPRVCASCSCELDKGQRARKVTDTRLPHPRTRYFHANWQDCQSGMERESIRYARSLGPAMNGIKYPSKRGWESR